MYILQAFFINVFSIFLDVIVLALYYPSMITGEYIEYMYIHIYVAVNKEKRKIRYYKLFIDQKVLLTLNFVNL